MASIYFVLLPVQSLTLFRIGSYSRLFPRKLQAAQGNRTLVQPIHC